MTRTATSVFLALFPLTAAAADWPQWLGPTRDGVWAEAGVVERFPTGGPKKLWQVPALGGYSGPAVVAGKVYVHEYERTGGNPVNDPNVRAALTGHERVRCLDAATGKEVWRKEFIKDCKAPVPTWGFAAHPLVTADAVVCMVGGPGGAVAAFDKITGREKWKALAGADAGYCPPTLTTVDGKAQLLVWHPKALVALTPDAGKALWEIKLEPMYGMSVAAPRRHGDHLFAGGTGGHAVLLKFEKGKTTPAELWRGEKDTAVYPTNSTPLTHGGTLYGCDSTTGGLRAVDLATGKRKWETFAPTTGKEAAKYGTAFLVRNGDRFFLMSETGELVIARMTADKYQEIDRAALIEPTGTAFGRHVAWSAPAFADGCVFVRNDKCVACYQLTAGK